MKESDLTERLIERDQIIDGVLLKAYRDKVELPDGEESVREWIKHPGASAVVPIFDNGDTILIRQYRYAAQDTFIEVPAGKLDEEGEDPEKVGMRELEEETGFRAGRLTYLGNYFPCIGYSDEIIYFYLGEHLEEGASGTDEEEFVEPFRISFVDAIQMVLDGRIRDMKTVVALLLAREHLADRMT